MFSISKNKRIGTLGALCVASAMVGAIPQAFAESEVDKMVDFYATLPAPVFEQLAPDYLKSGDGASVEGSGSFAGAQPAVPLDGVEVTFQSPPAPELAVPVISNVTFDGATPTIEFEVLDQFGFGIEGMEGIYGAYANKLIPRSNGLPPAWQAYQLGSDDGVENTMAGATRAGTFTDLGDGNYSFTYEQPLDALSGIMFEPELTHRFGIELRGPVFNGEQISNSFDTAFDIVPATGATEGIVSRNIVEQDACTACHGEPGGEFFSFHGGPRRDVKQCVSCHQPASKDGTTGNTIDLGVMIHAIHSSSDTYEIYRSRSDNFYSFEHVVYPQSVSNCVACHDPENEATPQAINIANAPTAEMCTSCHTDLALTEDKSGLSNANRNHLGLAQPDSTCAACHSDNGLMVNSLVEHANSSVLTAQKFQTTILEVTNSGEGQSPVVTFSIVDPTNDNAPYDLGADPEFTGSGVRLAMGFAWPNTDFSNVANDAGTAATGGPVGRFQSITLASSGPGIPAYMTDNGDGTFTVDTSLLDSPVVVPTTMPSLGSGTVVIEGHPAADLDFDGVYDEDVPASNATMAFAITDSAPVERRSVVDIALCQDCHGKNDGMALHGGNRSGNIEACATCHNPNATDLAQRPVDPDGIANGVNEAAIDGLEENPINMSYMIHAIHAATEREVGYVAYGFMGSIHDYSDAVYPRAVTDCESCHADVEDYTLPLADGVLATTVNSGATVLGRGGFSANAYSDAEAATNPADDNNYSAEAAVCVACHDSDFSKLHMAVRGESGISFGNAYLLNPDPIGDPDTQMRIDMEPQNCTFCHGDGGFVGEHGTDD